MNELEDNLNDYINGSISFVTYRERRADYINAFVGSGYLPDDTIPLNNTGQAQIKAAVQERMHENTPLDTSTYTLQGNISSQSKKQYIGLGVLIVAAALAWYYSSQLPQKETSLSSAASSFNSSPTLSTTNENNQERQASSSGKSNSKGMFEQEFITNFLKMDQWNSDTLSEFLVKWQALSRAQKKQTKQSQSFIRLKNSLRLRIREQQALQTTHNKAAQRQENLLTWFASQISVAVS